MGSKPSKSGRGADNSAAATGSSSSNTATKLKDKWATLPTTGIRGRGARGLRDGGGEEGEDVREQQHTSLTLERSFSGGGGERSEGAGETMSLRRRPTLGKRLRASCRNWAVARGLAKAANQEKEKEKADENGSKKGEETTKSDVPEIKVEDTNAKVEISEDPSATDNENKEVDIPTLVAELVIEAHKKKMASRAQSRESILRPGSRQSRYSTLRPGSRLSMGTMGTSTTLVNKTESPSPPPTTTSSNQHNNESPPPIETEFPVLDTSLTLDNASSNNLPTQENTGMNSLIRTDTPPSPTIDLNSSVDQPMSLDKSEISNDEELRNLESSMESENPNRPSDILIDDKHEELQPQSLDVNNTELTIKHIENHLDGDLIQTQEINNENVQIEDTIQTEENVPVEENIVSLDTHETSESVPIEDTIDTQTESEISNDSQQIESIEAVENIENVLVELPVETQHSENTSIEGPVELHQNEEDLKSLPDEDPKETSEQQPAETEPIVTEEKITSEEIHQELVEEQSNDVDLTTETIDTDNENEVENEVTKSQDENSEKSIEIEEKLEENIVIEEKLEVESVDNYSTAQNVDDLQNESDLDKDLENNEVDTDHSSKESSIIQDSTEEKIEPADSDKDNENKTLDHDNNSEAIVERWIITDNKSEQEIDSIQSVEKVEETESEQESSEIEEISTENSQEVKKDDENISVVDTSEAISDADLEEESVIENFDEKDNSEDEEVAEDKDDTKDSNENNESSQLSPNNEQIIQEEEKREVVTDNEEENSHDPDTVSPKSDTTPQQLDDESAQNTHDNVVDNSDKETESEEESENESACNPIQNGGGQKEDDSYDSSDDENECDPNNGGKGDKGASDDHSTRQHQDDLCPQISRTMEQDEERKEESKDCGNEPSSPSPQSHQEENTEEGSKDTPLTATPLFQEIPTEMCKTNNNLEEALQDVVEGNGVASVHTTTTGGEIEEEQCSLESDGLQKSDILQLSESEIDIALENNHLSVNESGVPHGELFGEEEISPVTPPPQMNDYEHNDDQLNQDKNQTDHFTPVNYNPDINEDKIVEVHSDAADNSLIDNDSTLIDESHSKVDDLIEDKCTVHKYDPWNFKESDSPDVDEESEFETYSGSHEDDRFQTHHVSDEETLILRFPSSFFNSLNGYCINEEEEITTQSDDLIGPASTVSHIPSVYEDNVENLDAHDLATSSTQAKSSQSVLRSRNLQEALQSVSKDQPCDVIKMKNERRSVSECDTSNPEEISCLVDDDTEQSEEDNETPDKDYLDPTITFVNLHLINNLSANHSGKSTPNEAYHDCLETLSNLDSKASSDDNEELLPVSEESVDTDTLEKKFNLQLKPFYDSATIDTEETFSIDFSSLDDEEDERSVHPVHETIEEESESAEEREEGESESTEEREESESTEEREESESTEERDNEKQDSYNYSSSSDGDSMQDTLVQGTFEKTSLYTNPKLESPAKNNAMTPSSTDNMAAMTLSSTDRKLQKRRNRKRRAEEYLEDESNSEESDSEDERDNSWGIPTDHRHFYPLPIHNNNSKSNFGKPLIMGTNTTTHQYSQGTNGATFRSSLIGAGGFGSNRSSDSDNDSEHSYTRGEMIDSDVNEYLVSFDTSTFYTTAGPGSLMFINNPFAGYIEDDRNGEELSSLESYDTVVPRGDWMLEALEEVDEDLYKDTSEEEDNTNDNIYDSYQQQDETDNSMEDPAAYKNMAETSESIVNDLLSDIMADVSNSDIEFEDNERLISEEFDNDEEVPTSGGIGINITKTDKGFESCSPCSSTADSDISGGSHEKFSDDQLLFESTSSKLSELGLSTDEGIAELSDDDYTKEKHDDDHTKEKHDDDHTKEKQIFHLDSIDKPEMLLHNETINQLDIGHSDNSNKIFGKLNLLQVADLQ